MVGYSGKADELKPLACLAGVTGGTFVAATNAGELKQGLTTIFDAIASPANSSPQAVAAEESPAQPSLGALPPGVASAVPMILEAAPQQAAPSEVPAAPEPAAATPQAAPPKVSEPASETAVLKSAARPPGETPPSAPPVRKVQSVPIAPPPAPQLDEAPPILAPTPKPAAQSVAAQVQLPVPVTFKALVTEQGPKLVSGLTWRVFAAKASPDGGGYQLLSTHREAVPTAALLPGEYLVNAAYGLSNLTKKIKVESGRSLEETFVLNTGGLKLTAALANLEVAPEGAVKFDILSDEEDQRGNRQTILHNAKAGLIIRLNAGAYRMERVLYGDANAIVRADVTVEPGKVTEASSSSRRAPRPPSSWCKHLAARRSPTPNGPSSLRPATW